MDKTQDKSLIDALAYCDLRSLPKEDNGEYVWIKALALVSKMDGTKGYALVIKGDNGKPKIMKDFGTVAAIKTIDKFYPFALLDEKYMPVFKTKGKEERIEWLTFMGRKLDFDKLTTKELNKEVVNTAVQTALRALNRNL